MNTSVKANNGKTVMPFPLVFGLLGGSIGLYTGLTYLCKMWFAKLLPLECGEYALGAIVCFTALPWVYYTLLGMEKLNVKYFRK